jgi:hypothetical protein
MSILPTTSMSLRSGLITVPHCRRHVVLSAPPVGSAFGAVPYKKLVGGRHLNENNR